MVHIVGAVTIGKRAYRKLSTRLVLSLLLVAALMMGIGLTLSKMLAPNSGSADTWVLRQLELSKPPSPLTVENTAWAAKTSALIERTHNWDGPFTGNFSEASRFDLYTTYYAVMTFQALNMPVPNKAQTIARVQSAQVREGTFQDDFHCKGASPENVQQGNLQDNLIGCTFYAVMTLDALGAKVNDEAAVIRLIDELQSDVSPYVFNNAALAPGEANLSPGEQSQQTQAAILYSRQALSILKKLGGQPQRADELRNWLLSQWNDNSQITQELRSISRLANIGEALELLGVRLADLSNAPARFAWARSFVSISDLSSGNKQVNLFAISDWLSLTSRLSGTQGSSDLLGDNFFQGLSELQQASGSFNAVLANEPDLQGTYLAAGLFRAAGRPIPGAEHIGELLRWQTLPEGGFRPVYKTGYSHPAFTVFSIDTLAMLGADEGDLSNTLTAKFAQDNISMVLTDSDENNDTNQVNGRDTRTKIEAADTSTRSTTKLEKDAKLIYYVEVLATRKGLDTAALSGLAEQLMEALLNSLEEGKPLNKQQVEDAYYLTRLLEVGQATRSKLERAVVASRSAEGAFGSGDWFTVESTGLALSILDNLQSRALSPEDRQETAAWIRRHQTPQGGYANAMQVIDLPDIVSSYWAVEGLRILEGKVAPNQKLIDFLRAVQLPEGGYKFTNNDGGPSIFATYYASLLAERMGIKL